MTESKFLETFIEEQHKKHPNNVYVPFLELKYSIGKYYKGKEFGMPDTILDVVEFDESENFHLWELKKLDSPEVWNGKFFGQIILYDFLFKTEPWNELFGRFGMQGLKSKKMIKGDLDKILVHLASYGKGKVAKKQDRKARFKTWNLVVCGGNGYEIAAGVNPIAWSFWTIAEEYFRKNIPEFNFHQFYKDQDSWNLVTIPNTNIFNGIGITEYAKRKWDEDGH